MVNIMKVFVEPIFIPIKDLITRRVVDKNLVMDYNQLVSYLSTYGNSSGVVNVTNMYSSEASLITSSLKLSGNTLLNLESALSFADKVMFNRREGRSYRLDKFKLTKRNHRQGTWLNIHFEALSEIDLICQGN